MMAVPVSWQSDVLVVLGSLGIGKDGGHLLVVLAAQHEFDVVESLLGQQRQRFGRDLDNLLALELRKGYTLLRKEAILGVVLAQLEHRGVLEIGFICHILLVFDGCINKCISRGQSSPS